MTMKAKSGLIQADPETLDYLSWKAEYFRRRDRVPRIILAQKSCSGAVFRLIFDAEAEGDIPLGAGETTIYVREGLLEEYQGFSLSTELFFFARRLKISPLKQSYKCDCEEKCRKVPEPGTK
ncbi:MAG TPA: hypothetical protein PLX77_00350 [Candidatus Cloacimonadota bacterium]|nr:hypothetical protein [Candidatus Cloacimonadota bacterium]